MINTNITKQQQQTTGLIQRLSNSIQLLSIGVIVSEKFCFRKCLFVVHKFALHGQQFSCQTGKGNRLKHRQFSQGVPVWRMIHPVIGLSSPPWICVKLALGIQGLNIVTRYSASSNFSNYIRWSIEKVLQHLVFTYT